MNDKLAALIEGYCAAAAPQAAAIGALGQALGDDRQTLEELRQGAHRMAGTAASLGFENFAASLIALEMRVRERLDGCAPGNRDIQAGALAIAAAGARLRPADSKLWSGPAHVHG